MDREEILAKLHEIIGIETRILGWLAELPEDKDLYQLIDKQSDELIEKTIEFKRRHKLKGK